MKELRLVCLFIHGVQSHAARFGGECLRDWRRRTCTRSCFCFILLLKTKTKNNTYSCFQCYMHSGYLLTSIFDMLSKQVKSKSTNHSPLVWPSELVAHSRRSDIKQTPICIGCNWLISNSMSKKMDVKRWMSKDSLHACNTESGYKFNQFVLLLYY